jgi:uncharacterized protein Yka (UPF0111/DUF47 family)
MLYIKLKRVMEEIIEKIETIIDDIERDHDLTKSEIVKSLYELKEEIEDHNLRRGDDTLQWEDLD